MSIYRTYTNENKSFRHRADYICVWLTVVDACELRAQVCGENALCVSRPGGQWQCQCQDGYYGDGEMCLDINECEIIGPLQHNCDEHAVCINTPGRSVTICVIHYIHVIIILNGSWV